MFRTFFIAAAALFVWGVSSGCASMPASGIEAQEANDRETKAIRVGRILLEAVEQEDFEKFARNAKGEFVKSMTKKDFDASSENMRQQFGTMGPARYLTSLKTPLVENTIWVVPFNRQGSEGQTIEQEVLFRVVTGQIDGEPCLVGFGFL